MLFLFNERGRTIPAVFPSYLGLAQGFTESHHALNVVFGGDGHYVSDRITDEELGMYRTLVVPSPVDPTDNQQQLLRQFVEKGGTVVCLEPQRLGLDAEGAEAVAEEGAWWTRRSRCSPGIFLQSGW